MYNHEIANKVFTKINKKELKDIYGIDENKYKELTELFCSRCGHKIMMECKEDNESDCVIFKVKTDIFLNV